MVEPNAQGCAFAHPIFQPKPDVQACSEFFQCSEGLFKWTKNIFLLKMPKVYYYIFITRPKLSFDNTLSLGRVKSIGKETENMQSSERLGSKSSLKLWPVGGGVYHSER